MRSKSINEFKSDPDCSVIMLSTEDSVSGLHLPEATHIFITHPFWFGSGRPMHEKALSAEKQGIARAYRLGLNHPLQIIRFYARGTIEERVSRERTEL
jgi:SNF2 family DNA or RNA helicase